MYDRQKPQPHQLYRHFKGNTYQVLCIAKHSETGEEMVVYQALYGDYGYYVRPLTMFMEPVDRVKHPGVSQKYRFEEIRPADEARTYSDSMAIPRTNEEPLPAEPVAAKSESAETEAPNVQAGEQANEQSVTAETESSEYTLDEDVERFLDADTYEQRVDILSEMRLKINDEMIDIMSTTIGIEVNEGPIQKRYERLMDAIMLRRRYEAHRLR